MNDNEIIKHWENMNVSFSNGTVHKQKPEVLQEWLNSLGSISSINGFIKEKHIIRALSINHIQMSKMLVKMNRQNTFLQIIIMILTAICAYSAWKVK